MNNFNLDTNKMARNDFEDVNLYDAESDVGSEGSFALVDVPTISATMTVTRGEELKKLVQGKPLVNIAEVKEGIVSPSKATPLATPVEASKEVDKAERENFAFFHREVNKSLVGAELKNEEKADVQSSSPPTTQTNIPSAESAILRFISTKSYSEIARLIHKINLHHVYCSNRYVEELRHMQAECSRRCAQAAIKIAKDDDRKLGQFQDLLQQMIKKAEELGAREGALERKREDMKEVTHEHEKAQRALMARALKTEGEVDVLKQRCEKAEKECEVQRERGDYYQGIIRRSREAELSVLRREGKAPQPQPQPQPPSQFQSQAHSSSACQGGFTLVPASFIDECKRRVQDAGDRAFDAETRARAAELRMRSAEKIVRNANEQLFEADQRMKIAEQKKDVAEEKLRRAKEIAREMEAIIKGVKDKEAEAEEEEEEEGEADEH